MRAVFLLFLLGLLSTPGCISFSIGTDRDPARVEVDGFAEGYIRADALKPYDGTLLRFGLLTEAERHGEIFSLDVWPLFGVGIGLVGARVRILPIEAGLGILFYRPRPAKVKVIEKRPRPAKVEESEEPPEPKPREAPEESHEGEAQYSST